MKGQVVEWANWELRWIKRFHTLPRAELHAHFVALTGRTDVSVAALKALCQRRGWLTGRTGCFVKGQAAFNKGQRRPLHPNSARTVFHKGQRPHTYKGPGHERVDTKDGYVILIVAERNPRTGAATRPVHKHRWLWERANGPVPEGMVLKCLDGDKLNTDPSNWTAIPRGMLPRLSGRWNRAYDDAPSELKPTLLATARLEHAVREASK